MPDRYHDAVSTRERPYRAVTFFQQLPFSLALARPMQDANETMKMSTPEVSPTRQAPEAESTTTPSVVRPGDAYVKDSNRKGGTGGANSTGNGG